MTEPLDYAVLLARQDEPKLQEIAKVLSAIQKIPLQDAARLARTSWGILGEKLDKDTAADLAGRLKDASMESLVLPQGLIEELPPPALAASLEFLPSGVRANIKGGNSETLVKEQIRLIAAAGLKQTITTTVKIKEGPSPTQKAVSMGLMMAGLPISIGGKSREVEQKKQTTELFFYLDLYLRNPVRRFRIDAQNFDFSCLKARMGFTAHQNFRILVLEMIRLCPQAMISRGTKVLFDSAPIASMGYDSIADLDRESRWLLTLDSLQNP